MMSADSAASATTSAARTMPPVKCNFVKSAEIYCGRVQYPVKQLNLSKSDNPVKGVLTCVSPISMGSLIIVLEASAGNIEPRVIFNGNVCKIYNLITSELRDEQTIKVTFVAKSVNDSSDSADED